MFFDLHSPKHALSMTENDHGIGSDCAVGVEGWKGLRLCPDALLMATESKASRFLRYRSARRFQLRVEPGPGKRPMTPDGWLSNAQGISNFLVIHPYEIAKFHDL